MNIPNLNIFTSTELRFVQEVHLTADIYAFHFKPQKPLKHQAGQAGFLTVPGGGTKFLTLSSSPNDEEVVFATHTHPTSTFKQALRRLHPGDAVEFRGPFIGATLGNKHGTQVVFLTQGIGITPHRSILRHIAHSKLPVHTTLIHVDRSGHPFSEETQMLATEAYFPESSNEFKRRVSEVVGKQPDAAYYVAGGLRFYASTLQLLKQLGIKSSAIHHDRLANYMNKSVITPYHDLTDRHRKRAQRGELSRFHGRQGDPHLCANVDLARVAGDNPAAAGPDLLRELVQAFAGALISVVATSYLLGCRHTENVGQNRHRPATVPYGPREPPAAPCRPSARPYMFAGELDGGPEAR